MSKEKKPKLKNLLNFEANGSTIFVKVSKTAKMHRKSAPQCSRGVVFVVDDEEFTAKYNASIIEYYFPGIKTEIFTTACAALIAIPSVNCIGVIIDGLLDSTKCNINSGLELARVLQEQYPRAPRMFCTANDSAGTVKEMKKLGSYCKKPLQEGLDRYISNPSKDDPIANFITEMMRLSKTCPC